MKDLNINTIGNTPDAAYLESNTPDASNLPPPTLQVGLFTGVWGSDNKHSSRRQPCHQINLSIDSYIIAFTGSRGSGKTTAMTLFAIKEAICNQRRVISSYPIEFNCLFPGHGVKHFQLELLDWERLLLFDNEYRNALLLLDEAPDAISNLASMSWKNRLVNIFVRQIRKNRNSLFLAAQHIDLIDKSLRWQVDVEMSCQDASRRYGWPPSERGKVILVQALDWSGQWTGQTWQEHARYSNSYGPNFKIYPRVLWGTPGKTKPAFDSWYVTDVWESLKKVDMRLEKYHIGPGGESNSIDRSGVFGKASQVIEAVINQGARGVDTKGLYGSLGNITPAERDAVAKRLKGAGAILRRSGNRRYYDIQNFDINKFNEMNN